jgi:hypothetical protein
MKTFSGQASASATSPEPHRMILPPLPSALYDRLRDDIRHKGIQIPVLVDNATGERA